jgi:type III pantothenate kinase
VVAGVRPRSEDALLAWLQAHGDTARVLGKAAELPLVVKLPEPDKAGIDRLLAAVGANARRAVNPNPAASGAIVVGVGTAITVDLIDGDGTFCGGAILPGPRLMALALHEHTALLPLVEAVPPWPAAPATATRPAIELGIHWAMVGGINGLVREMGARVTTDPEALDVFVTGGGAALVIHRLIGRTHHCPELVLEGICRTAKSLP